MIGDLLQLRELVCEPMSNAAVQALEEAMHTTPMEQEIVGSQDATTKLDLHSRKKAAVSHDAIAEVVYLDLAAYRIAPGEARAETIIRIFKSVGATPKDVLVALISIAATYIRPMLGRVFKAPMATPKAVKAVVAANVSIFVIALLIIFGLNTEGDSGESGIIDSQEYRVVGMEGTATAEEKAGVAFTSHVDKMPLKTSPIHLTRAVAERRFPVAQPQATTVADPNAEEAAEQFPDTASGLEAVEIIDNVSIELHGLPEGAIVTVDEEEYDVPIVLSRSNQPVTIDAFAQGYSSFSLCIVPDKHRKFDVEMYKY